VLTQNRLGELADLDPLAKLPRLEHLTLLDNPVTSKPHYRAWAVWRCRALRFLDFVKVKDGEREAAVELFGEDETEMTELAKKIAATRSVAGLSGGGGYGDDLNGDGISVVAGGRIKLTAAEKKKVEQMIREAKSFAEIERLEKILNEGRIPGGAISDKMET
jgi:U2 small nuclear ribonucleoprotein A'